MGIYAERCGEFCRAIAPVGSSGFGAAERYHPLPFHRFDCPEQHSGGEPLRFGDCVEAPVHSVGKVNISRPGGPYMGSVRCVRPALAWQPRSVSPIYASVSVITPTRRISSNMRTSRQPSSSRATVSVGRLKNSTGSGCSTQIFHVPTMAFGRVAEARISSISEAKANAMSVRLWGDAND